MRSWVVGVGLGLFSMLVGCAGQSRGPGADGSAGSANEGDACKAGKGAYQQKRAQIVATAEATGCQADADCGVLEENNGCVVTCGTALPASTITNASSELEAIAKAQCESCPPQPIPPCVPPQPLTCQQGKCVN